MTQKNFTVELWLSFFLVRSSQNIRREGKHRNVKTYRNTVKTRLAPETFADLTILRIEWKGVSALSFKILWTLT